jgi:hypothetical protein
MGLFMKTESLIEMETREDYENKSVTMGIWYVSCIKDLEFHIDSTW